MLVLELEKQGAEHAAVGLEGQFQIVQDREVFKDGRLLKLTTDPEIGNGRLVQFRKVTIPVKQDPTLIGPRPAGHDIKHRCLTGAIGTDYRSQFAFIDNERKLV